MIGNNVKAEYWDRFKVEDTDLDFIYNLLLETELPQTIDEILRSLIIFRINQEKLRLEQLQRNLGTIYLPKDDYKVGESLVIPALNMQSARVTQVRQGFNPDMEPFKVLEVTLSDGKKKQFAACLEDHKLNHPTVIDENDPNEDVDTVIQSHGGLIKNTLMAELESNPNLVRIGFTWFPKPLLVDVNLGYLNLAEALLEMESGIPLPASRILEQIDLPTDVNRKLTEFSLNYALQVDERFDEVGPAGEILWCLNRLEPEYVRELPHSLSYQPVEYDRELVEPYMSSLDSSMIHDELEPENKSTGKPDKIQLAMIYPHVQAGTLPLTNRMQNIFPTAYQSPRVLFTFVDGNTQQRFSGWVVRAHNYIGGLKEWYQKTNVIPGSIISLQKSNNPGEVIIRVDHKRSKDWIRTALVGADGGIVFAMLKQPISTTIDERMAIYIPDQNALDKIWTANKGRKMNLEKKIKETMRDLSKLNPQGHVHAVEIYSVINISSRVPPGLVLSMLLEKPWSFSIGDLYFRLQESGSEENNSG